MSATIKQSPDVGTATNKGRKQAVTRALLAVGFLSLAAAATAPAQALTPEELAKAKGCFVCHGAKGSGGLAPSFGDIARRFEGLANAKMMLMPIVHAGTGEGAPYHWGPGKMPPEDARQPVTDEEAAILIDYILSSH
ncbi:c-type cytochrome [Zavarzinia sp.]|uniref:c-type cytochrome n=1 Tax=Zavarzinia sp. TaxID=2027920 RepID=UPI00356354F2